LASLESDQNQSWDQPVEGCRQCGDESNVCVRSREFAVHRRKYEQDHTPLITNPPEFLRYKST
jgi:hypothetical protein